MKPAHEDSSTNTTQPEAGTNTTTAAEVQARVETAPQHSITTSQFSLNDNQSSSQLPTGSLLEGTYDEAASAASFQQALAQWRGGGGVRDKAENTVACKGMHQVLSQSIIINLIPRFLCDEANDQYALPYLFSSLTSD